LESVGFWSFGLELCARRVTPIPGRRRRFYDVGAFLSVPLQCHDDALNFCLPFHALLLLIKIEITFCSFLLTFRILGFDA